MMSVAINADRLWERLTALGAIGVSPHGGLTRLSYTYDHAQAVRLVADWMRQAGMQVTLDPVGNLVGVWPGDRDDLPAICVASHLDTVPSGGRFDGALGVLGGVECVAALSEAGVRLRRPVMVVAFADEEGNQFGVGCLTSRVWCGEYPPERWSELGSTEGGTLASRVAAFDPGLPRRDFPALPAAYFELHIEQGPELDRRGLPVAAVTGIAGIHRASLTFVGEANHAGTTPMDLRRDALWGAAQTALAVRAAAFASEGRAVATVGQLVVEPGATNVVPGKATLRVELRSAEPDVLTGLEAEVERVAQAAAAQYGLTLDMSAWHRSPPTPMDARLVEAVERGMRARGFPATRLPSWAGHDAKIVAGADVPTAMIFTPSAGGISHNPAEYTSLEGVAAGVAVLTEAVIETDHMLASS